MIQGAPPSVSPETLLQHFSPLRARQPFPLCPLHPSSIHTAGFSPGAHTPSPAVGLSPTLHRKELLESVFPCGPLSSLELSPPACHCLSQETKDLGIAKPVPPLVALDPPAAPDAVNPPSTPSSLAVRMFWFASYSLASPFSASSALSPPPLRVHHPHPMSSNSFPPWMTLNTASPRNLPPKPSAHCTHHVLACWTVNYIKINK